MNLRTHTYLIPAVAGVAAFAVLVAADFSVRRGVHGDGYDIAAYLGQHLGRHLGTSASAAAAGAVEIASNPFAAPDQPVQPAPGPQSGFHPAMLTGLAVTARLAPAPMPLPPQSTPLTQVTEVAELTLAEANLDISPLQAGDGHVRTPAARPIGLGATCTVDHGFKRCRLGN